MGLERRAALLFPTKFPCLHSNNMHYALSNFLGSDILFGQAGEIIFTGGENSYTIYNLLNPGNIVDETSREGPATKLSVTVFDTGPVSFQAMDVL